MSGIGIGSGVKGGNAFNSFQYGLGANVLEAVLFNGSLYNNMPFLGNAITAGTQAFMKLKGKNLLVPTSYAELWGYQSTPATGTATPATGYTRLLWTAAQNLAVVSDSTNDVNTSGTGAWQLTVWYLDANFLPHVAVFNLNGQTAVTSAASIDGGSGGTVNAIRVNHSEVTAAGTGRVNAGNLYVTSQGGQTYSAGVPQLAYASWTAGTNGGVTDVILAGDNVSSTFNFTVPAGYSGAIIMWSPSYVGAGTTQLFANLKKSFSSGPNGLPRWTPLAGLSNATNADMVTPQLFELVPAGGDIQVLVQAGATSAIGTEADLLLWPNVA